MPIDLQLFMSSGCWSLDFECVVLYKGGLCTLIMYASTMCTCKCFSSFSKSNTRSWVIPSLIDFHIHNYNAFVSYIDCLVYTPLFHKLVLHIYRFNLHITKRTIRIHIHIIFTLYYGKSSVRYENCPCFDWN